MYHLATTITQRTSWDLGSLSRECLYIVLLLVGKGLTCQIDAGMSKTGPERGWLTKLTRLQLIPSMYYVLRVGASQQSWAPMYA